MNVELITADKESVTVRFRREEEFEGLFRAVRAVSTEYDDLETELLDLTKQQARLLYQNLSKLLDESWQIPNRRDHESAT